MVGTQLRPPQPTPSPSIRHPRPRTSPLVTLPPFADQVSSCKTIPSLPFTSCWPSSVEHVHRVGSLRQPGVTIARRSKANESIRMCRETNAERANRAEQGCDCTGGENPITRGEPSTGQDESDKNPCGRTRTAALQPVPKLPSAQLHQCTREENMVHSQACDGVHPNPPGPRCSRAPPRGSIRGKRMRELNTTAMLRQQRRTSVPESIIEDPGERDRDAGYLETTAGTPPRDRPHALPRRSADMHGRAVGEH